MLQHAFHIVLLRKCDINVKYKYKTSVINKTFIIYTMVYL